MKTDRFTDIIRRKLESIRPEFSEKDWQRMQATLQQASPPQPGSAGGGHSTLNPAWTAQPWLMAAATISTVALITLSIWQRREINQLRETLAQSDKQTSTVAKSSKAGTKQSESLAQSALPVEVARTEKSNASPSLPEQIDQSLHRDTVYITRYVTVPSRQEAADPTQSAQHERLTNQRYATAQPKPSVADGELVPNTTIPNAKIELNDKLSTQNTTSRSATNNSPLTTAPETNQVEKGQYRSQERTTYNNPRATTSANTPDVVATNESPNPQSTSSAPEVAATGATTTNYELVTSLPLSLGKIDWSTALVHRAKRMRISRPATTISQPTVSRPIEHLTFKFRVGPTVDVSTHTWNIGGVAEVLVNDKFSLSAGLTRSTYLIGTFLTTEDFDVRTHRDFRRQFAREIDPRSDILNIDTRMVRVQLPICVGYRIPISQSFTLSPTIGTNLNLNNTETLTFYYRMPLRGFESAYTKRNWPIDLFTNFNLSTSLEWHRGHWAGQAGPIATISLPQNGPIFEQEVGIGLRARVLYQF
jgi:hypothetical protein